MPTFDRLTSNDKVLPTQPDPPKTILVDAELEKHLLTSNNRRSVSLHNVILTLPTNENAEQPLVHSKPPLPPGKSVTVSKLPPTGRSFRGTLGNSKRSYYSQSIEHARLSIEDLEKSLQGAASIDQWIDSLPVLGTPSLNRNKTTHPNRTVASTNNKKIKRSYTIGDEYNDEILNGSYREEKDSLINTESNMIKDEYPNILTLKFNREFLNLAKQLHLNNYLKDFFLRLKTSKMKQTFKNHFCLSTIIYPLSVNLDQTLADDLHLYIFTPIESILPDLSLNTHSTYKIHEQLRSKCYFIPQTDYKIEANDDEYQRKCIELDRTHVVITLDNEVRSIDDNSSIKKTPVEPESSCIFISDNSFHQGFLRIEQNKLAKHFLPFVYHSTDDNQSYLSSNLIQQWFNTLLLVNQTCTIAKRFLIGDGSHITCLIKQQNHHTFTALRLPPYMHLNDSISPTIDDETSPIIDAFSSRFLSDNKNSSNDTIHIDYEQYSFAFLLHRWPKDLLDNYSTRIRRWPSKYHLNILIKKSPLLVPFGQNHQWQLNFDPIEQDLFELMNETTLYFYSLCQQLFTSSVNIRNCLKHCFLNYCETYGLPFSNQREYPTDNLRDLLVHFFKDIQKQLNVKFIRHYFNHDINLYENNDTFQQWFDSINSFLENTQTLPTIQSIDSNRSIIVEFLFHFIDQLYQTFHIKRSQFHLNEDVLLDLHKQLCEKLSNDTNNNSTFIQKFINHLLNNKDILEHIQTNLMFDFETNAELVHTCLNQVRKADSSLIFHYTWTIYIQYLHTYYNILWNI